MATKQEEYVAIESWTDSEHKRVYNVNDPYPYHKNVKVSAERIKYLMSSDHDIGRPVIKVKEAE